MTYREQLKTEHWKLKRLKVLKRDNFKCVECGSTEKLEAHHNYYSNGKMAWEYPMTALKTLCNTCHNNFHDNHVKVKSKSKVTFIKRLMENFTGKRLHNEIFYDDLYECPSWIIRKRNTKVLTACSFIQITGKAKTCKTNILMSIMGGCFSEDIDTLGLDINLCPADKHVIYVNTEMSAYDTWKHLKLLVDRIGYKPDNLHFLNYMDTRGKELRDKVETALQSYPPYLLIIDGVVDACEDFNNQVFSKMTVDWLSKLCNIFACGCIVALHQNPEAISKESKSRGHLGTFIEQRAISTFSTSKQRDYLLLRCSRMRHGTEFEVKYIWTPEGLETIDYNHEDPYLTIIRENQNITRSELVKLIAKTMNVSEAAVSKKIKRLGELKLIEDNKATKAVTLFNGLKSR